jgi:hypothetical protein
LILLTILRKKGGAGRTRKTEKEEDEEMLQKADAELEEDNAFSFSESPECINLNLLSVF